MKESESKIVGNINKKVCDDLHLKEQLGKPIKMAPTLLEHIAKHSVEYENVDSCLYTLSNISDILNNPDYIYYNETNKSIEYYKFLKEYVSVVVKVTNKKSLFIASIYPVKKAKIDNRMEKKAWKKYVKIDEKMVTKEKVNN